MDHFNEFELLELNKVYNWQHLDFIAFLCIQKNTVLQKGA